MVFLGASPSTSAVRLQGRLQRWDKGNRTARMRQLEEFIDECTNMTGPQLEHYFENGASLFLARVSSWLRLSYVLGQSVGLQLKAIALFVAASSGQRFLAEFVEVGGVATVIEILKLTDLSQEDKACATSLIGAVASAGRHYKEIICEGKGVTSLETLMRASKSEDQLERVRDLLVHLGRGNPLYSTQARAAKLQGCAREHAGRARVSWHCPSPSSGASPSLTGGTSRVPRTPIAPSDHVSCGRCTAHCFDCSRQSRASRSA
jgi:hypothetical protein